MTVTLAVYLVLLFGLPLTLTFLLALRHRARLRKELSSGRVRIPVDEIVARVAGERAVETRRQLLSGAASDRSVGEADRSRRNLAKPLVSVPAARSRRYIAPEYRAIFPRGT